MGSLWYTDMADLYRAAGLDVEETDGWQTRSRSSGGFSSAPLGVQWHHTASNTTPANDLNYMIYGSDSAPVGNLLLDRDGVVHLIAAGASNCAGKGGPTTMSRGTVPLDSGNSTTWAMEVANNGVGQEWPQVQIDAYFIASNVANQRFGNQPTDLFSHAFYAPDRKIDPATAAAVKGPWKPRSINSSGTWNNDDIRNEATRRWSGTTQPTPEPGPEPEPPTEEDDVTRLYLAKLDTNPNHLRRGDGNIATIIRSNEVGTLKSRMDRGDPGRSGSQTYYNPLDDTAIHTWADIPSLNEGQLDMDVGYILATSQTSADEG